MFNRHFLSFGAGRRCYRGALKRLAKEIRLLDPSANIWFFDESIIGNELTGLDESFLEFVKSNTRGFGLWIWKPWILEKMLNEIPDGDIVFYLDAGTTVHTTGASKLRYKFYIDHILQNGHLFFQQTFKEYNWTKSAVLKQFKLKPNDIETGQVLGGVHGHRSNPQSRLLISEWRKLCTVNSGEFLKDVVDISAEDPRFIGHRHDASILSCLVKSVGIQLISDETFFHPNWNQDGADYPFWATRKCSGVPSWMGYYAPISWPHVAKSRLLRSPLTGILDM
jgi:hypothetical protein